MDQMRAINALRGRVTVALALTVAKPVRVTPKKTWRGTAASSQ
jgi:hypothetical protein